MVNSNDQVAPGPPRGQTVDNRLDSDRISSPAATGGAGTFFEQNVAAYWLAQLLVGGIPPILHRATVVEVHLQTEHLGWHTDDFLIICRDGSGHQRKLAGQVKRSFRVSSSNEECRRTMEDFWKDFKDPGHFAIENDRFAIVIQRGTNTLLEHFAGLLDCARAARDAAEFEHRLTTPGFVSTKVREYCVHIQEIIGDVEGRSIVAGEVWSFLRVLHVLSLDLSSATHQTEAMIKSLLAHTTDEQDLLGAAEASWATLLQVAGSGMSEARSFRHDDLPGELRQRHAELGSSEQRALGTLADHSTLILDGIRSTIGNELHLKRARLTHLVMQELESNQVVLISGPAGSGKSSIAKDVITVLATEHFTFAFRAEEFAHPHLDGTLQSSQVPANAAMLRAILASQDRKILLVESVERLLEKLTRDAFNDLLTLVATDRSWRLILTCRDYSADLVRTGFLEFANIGYAVVPVPHLDDDELSQVESTYPELARPLNDAGLRELLRNPYILDKALQIPWTTERSLPQNERDFRALFWHDIVRVDYHAAGGMPRRREETLIQIAVRRARALSLHVHSTDLDPEAVERLKVDSLVVSPEGNPNLLAPAHDVIEDWAILRWIDEQHALYRDAVGEFSQSLGTYPAIRRTYRKWIGELLERDPRSADELFEAVVHEEALSAQFRDDTLVSLLRSPASTAFLHRHSAELFANNKQLLRRVIHLLRVACVTTPAWLPRTETHASLFNVPDGSAWACVLQLLQAHLQSFAREDQALLLGLIKNWAQGVTRENPYPKGAESVVSIAHWLLIEFGGYQYEDKRKQVLEVIAKIPAADPERFAELLRTSARSGERDGTTEEIRRIILAGLKGMPAVRDMPDLVVAAAKDYLLCSEADLRRERYYSSSLRVETVFGISPSGNHGFFPASAYRGPYLSLLQYHPQDGLNFIVDVFNHSADWYAHPRVPDPLSDAPFEITLTFADGTSQTQWCNPRLWNLYRGASVGPYALQSFLMALERWLLVYAESYPQRLDTVLLSILRRSYSAALTAVVASVATAHPYHAGETLLVLLSSPMCIQLDRHRMALERQTRAAASMFDALSGLNASDKIYHNEREEANAWSHRDQDLEMAILSLQLSSFAPRVHEILDSHRSELPSTDEQDDGHRSWRLSMHRMDLRRYSLVENMRDASATTQDSAPIDDENGPQYIQLSSKTLDADVQEMVDQSSSELQSFNASLGLLMWAHSVFSYEDEPNYDPVQWKERLQEAQSRNGEDSTGSDLVRGGPGYVAAVCVRDHWNEMSSVDRDWCLGRVCSQVEREGNNWNRFERVQVNSMSADRPCAWVLPLLVGKPTTETQSSQLKKAFPTALTHAVGEVRQYAALGIGRHLWEIDRNLALRSVNALATEALLVQEAVEARAQKLDEAEAEAAVTVRLMFYDDDAIAEDAYQTLNVSGWFGAEANKQILAILAQAPTESAAKLAFERLAQTLVQWWNRDVEARPRVRQEWDYRTEATLTELLVRFLLRTNSTYASSIVDSLIGAMDRYPDKVHRIVQKLISIEDRQPNTPQFWSLWTQFANGVRQARWLRQIDDEHARGEEMLSAIFLNSWWKDEVRHWRSLEGYDEHIHGLFEALPTSSTVFDKYIRFLYHIGEQSLPEAFVRVANQLQQGSVQQVLRSSNTIFMLEVLLRPFIYGRPLELKRRRTLREAVLFLLDSLVENGSSAAFRMRDDFVTPIPAHNDG